MEVKIAAAFINGNAQIFAEAVVSYTCHRHSSCDSAARGRSGADVPRLLQQQQSGMNQKHESALLWMTMSK